MDKQPPKTPVEHRIWFGSVSVVWPWGERAGFRVTVREVVT